MNDAREPLPALLFRVVIAVLLVVGAVVAALRWRVRSRRRRAEATLDALVGPECWICEQRGPGPEGDKVEFVWIAGQFMHQRHPSCVFRKYVR